MADELKILRPDSTGAFSLQNLSRSNLARIDIADVDLVLTMKDGSRFILPNAGIDAMGQEPPKINFSDNSTTLDILLTEVGVITDLKISDSSITTESLDKTREELKKKEEEEKELKEKLEQLEKELQKTQAEAEKTADEYEEYKDQQEKKSDSDSVTTNTETAVEKMVAEAKRIEENLHRSDKDYADPVRFSVPTSPMSAAPGLPPPISLTPIATISLGNAVGTTIVGNNIYGGGGAAGSGAEARIGARDPLQFSAATITGTSGNDVIYTDGPLVGNPNPSVDRSNNAKEFLLNVAGYFTALNDVIISGVPAGVSFEGATNNGDGTWTVPSSSVIDGVPVKMIYNMDAWRGGASTFDLTFNISGLSTRGVTFETVQSFRFMYLDVTNVSQVTDQTLIYEAEGQLKQIYILPTLSQPSVINSGEGDDIIYGGRNRDEITTGNGNNEIYAGAGDDLVVTGNGNNIISLGAGNNALTAGSGNDTITAADGENVIYAGDGANSITVADGDNTITAGVGDDTLRAGNGSNIIDLGEGANDIEVGNGINSIITGAGLDTILTGTGAITINAGAGDNQITTGGGAVDITVLGGNDTITVNGGGGTINAGEGNNIITVSTGNYTINAGAGNDNVLVNGNGNNIINVGNGTNTVSAGDGNNTITSGSGNDTLTAGNGNNIFRPGLGTNIITGGAGSNTLDYTVITTTAAIISLTAGTATGTGLSDTFSGIQNAIGTQLGDTISGTTGDNIIRGGDGNDIITGNGGNDTLYGDEGDDTITGGSGNDTIYAGNGNNTVYSGVSGNDSIYGGTGNNTFISQHAGVYYNGTNGAALLVSQYNTVDYSADTVGMTINLQSGSGSGGLSQGDIYAFTSVFGYNSINHIIGGSGADVLTGSSSDDILDGRGGNDNLFGGAGNDVLIGGTGSNNYYGGAGADTFMTSASGTDIIRYDTSTSSAVINFDSISRSFVNSLGVTISLAAYTGGNKGVTAADLSSDSTGDIFIPVSGTNLSIEEFYGSNFGDIIFGGGTPMAFYSGSGQDFLYGGSANELFTYSRGNDRIDAGGGADVIWAGGPNGGNYGVNSIIYLDANLDTNGNGIADYIDRGITLTSGGITYTGFATGTTGHTTLLLNFENLLGEQGNDYLVGNNNANTINGKSGNNTMFGMGGDDIIHAAIGANTIDGGSGTDTVDFSNSFYGSGTTTSAYVFLSDASFMGGSDKAIYSVGSSFQARTGTGTFSTIVNVENITGSSLSDVLYGDSSNNVIRGGDGADIIAGNGGADSLYGENGDDIFYATSAQLAATTLFSGGAGIDTIRAAGLALTAGSIASVGSKYLNIESLDIRNNLSGGTYSINANDVTALFDPTGGATPRVQIHIDTGDTLNIETGATSGAMSSVVASTSATLTTYYLYSDANHTAPDAAATRVGIVDVYTGV